MTVSSETSKILYAGNDSTTAFAVPFYFLANADLRVVLINDTTGIGTVQTETTHYTVAGAGNPAGGTVTMITAPATGETLLIKRDLDLKQETDYVPNDPFPAESHEEALDRLTMIAQQVDEKVDRAILAPEGDDGTVDYTLPGADSLKLMRWNTAADALENINVEDLGAVSISDFGKTLIDDADAAAARTTLGLGSAALLADETVAPHATTHDMASDANYTLTSAQNIYGRYIITDTGVVLTAGRNIIVDDSERDFFAQNDTAQTLTFKTSAGTGIAVLAGNTRLLLCDGTNVIDPQKNSHFPAGHIQGLLWSNNATDATNDFDISAGECKSEDDTADLVLSSGQTKQMDAAWATGTNAGALATGATAWAAGVSYHVFIGIISGAVEIIVDSDPDAANAIANNGLGAKRHIFSFLASTGPALPTLHTSIVGSNVRAVLDVMARDVSNTGSTSGALATLSVPTGTQVLATLLYFISQTSIAYGILTETTQTNTTPSITAFDILANSGSNNNQVEVIRLTDTNGQVRYRNDASLTSNVIATKSYEVIR